MPEQRTGRLAKAAQALERGEWQAAEALARAGLKRSPRDVDFLGVLGVSLFYQRKFQEALAPLVELHERNPGCGMGGPLGQCYLETGDAANAVRILELAVHEAPGSAELRNLLAISLARQFRHAEAQAVLQSALEIHPGDADTYINLGCLFHETGSHEDAIRNFRQAAELNPGLASAYSNLGHSLKALMRHDEAIECFHQAALLGPHDAEVHNSLGITLAEIGLLEAAAASYRTALSIRPDLVKASYNLGLVLKDLKRHDEAIACFEETLQRDPGHKYALSALAGSERAICRWEGYPGRLTQLNQAVVHGLAVVEPFVFLWYSDDPAAQRLCAEHSLEDLLPASLAALWKGDRYQHEEIRLAYVSADINAHAVASLIAGVFEKHDRARFSVTCVSLVAGDGSEMRARLENAFDHFLDASRMSDDEIARLLRENDTDIVVDLTGMTARARPGIFARRPAPIQVNFLGYPGTLGGKLADYIIADPFIVPEGQEAHYSEKVVRLPDCYQPRDSAQAIDARVPLRSEVGLPEGAFVFCSFNNTFKITPACFETWMRLLSMFPASVLWLFQDNTHAERSLRDRARARGVDPQRLIFAPKVSVALHLARHQLADLFLDTLPYNAHTTASDSLWAGLPVLTCAGTTFAGRVAGSLLHAAGLPELVTSTMQEYEVLAVRLAGDPVLLAELRGKLAKNRLTCPLFNTDRFRLNLEKAYEAMWRLARQQRAPEAISVEVAP